MIYLKQYNSFFNSPVVEEPNRDFGKYWDNPLFPKHFYENDFNKDLNTYNQWKQSAIPVVGEHLFENGKEYQEGVDYRIEKEITGGRSVKSAEGIPYDYETYFKLVAIPIKRDNERERGIVISDDDCDFGDDYFEPCDHCDLPDACADFGCALKSGVRKDHPIDGVF